MLTLLNLLSAVTLLIWGTHIVRTGILRVYGSNLRQVIGQNMSKRWLAFVAGILVTAMVQSSNATAMLVTSFVGQGLMGLTPALATMLGADVGTALMARVLTFDLSWLSPLLIFLGVIFFLSRKQTRAGQMGRVGIGLGLIILALQLIVEAAGPITHAQGVKVIFASLTGDILLDALVGALFAMISYSSLAAVLLTATLAGAGVIGLHVAIGLVIGANIGSGVLAFLSTSMQNAAGRQVALGSLLYKLIGLLLIIPVLDPLVRWMDGLDYSAQGMVITFHLLGCVDVGIGQFSAGDDCQQQVEYLALVLRGRFDHKGRVGVAGVGVPLTAEGLHAVFQVAFTAAVDAAEQQVFEQVRQLLFFTTEVIQAYAYDQADSHVPALGARFEQ
jgi:phosphate:Na+ symporter